MALPKLPIIKTQRDEPVVNSYDKNGNLNTTFSSTGLELQPRPDFWSDMAQIVRRLRPVPVQSGVQQAAAIRAQPQSQPATFGSTAPNEGSERQARYVKLVGFGPQSTTGYVAAQYGDPGAVAAGWE